MVALNYITLFVLKKYLTFVAGVRHDTDCSPAVANHSQNYNEKDAILHFQEITRYTLGAKITLDLLGDVLGIYSIL